jgi:uncharacterized protein (DUF362 family)
VAVCRSKKLLRRDNDVDVTPALEAISRSIMEITGKGEAKEAWRSIFSPSERVALKLSCLPGIHLSSARGIAQAIVRGLETAGVKRKNIYIWERTRRELKRAGFQQKNFPGINVIGTDEIKGGGYLPEVEISGEVGTCFSRIIKQVDSIISVPVLKDHDIAGVSVSMKNFYGVIHNPNKFHGNNCDPYVADLMSHPYIKNKLKLTVCDAARIQIHNGPAHFPRYAVEYGGLLVSRDPVALDYTGWEIIEARRKEFKLKSLKEEGRFPSYIFTAGERKLGFSRRDKIQLKKIAV